MRRWGTIWGTRQRLSLSPRVLRGCIKECIDIDECHERRKCQCPECKCTNKWGGYDCECWSDLLYIREHDTCISKKSQQSKIGWAVFVIVLMAVATRAVGGYVVYKYRPRSYMDSEIRARLGTVHGTSQLW